MPIENKNLGKYKRPGIYINEIDQSILELPIQDVLINLVPGFSKKGPFNRPVRVDSPAEFEAIFGTIDKNLENKGSFFHRTVEDMLNTGPIWALSLLKTDPNRDTLEWESISASVQYNNGPKNTSPYERFFNRQDFWERDSESFGDIVISEHIDHSTIQPDPNQDIFSITNIGNFRTTIWLFKSSVTGFDVTAENWYGGSEKVPLFMNPKDLISDYIISVLAVGGDWTQNETLAVDAYWGKYFNVNGLIKSQVSNFWNDSLTNTVAFYDVSLIPNFRDLNDVDMYIKDVINSQTDKTGLFCYFNEDVLLGSDFYKGNIDLIGQTLVGSIKKSIDFLSYNGTISETQTYTEKSFDSLNSPTNVFGNLNSELPSGRTAGYTNWYTNISPSGDTTTGKNNTYVYNVVSVDGSYVITLTGVSYSMIIDDVIYFNKSFSEVDTTTPYYITSVTGNKITVSETKGGPIVPLVSGTTINVFVYCLKQNFVDSSVVAADQWSYIIGQTKYSADTALTSHNLFFDPFAIYQSGSTYSRYDVLYLDSDYSTVHTLKGNQTIGISPTLPNYLLSNENTILLGYVKLQYNSGVTASAGIPYFEYTYTKVSVSAGNSYLPLSGVTDVTATSGITSGINYLDLTFVGTKGSTDYTLYNKLRKMKIFTEIYTNLINNKGVIISGGWETGTGYGDKFPISSPTIYASTTSTDAYIRIYFDSTLVSSGISTNPFDYFKTSDGSFLIYYIDNEFVLTGINAVNTLISSNHPLNYYGPTDKTGIVAKWSNLYQDYYNGIINNGDYFFVDNVSGDTMQKVFLKMYLSVVDGVEILTIKFVDEAGDPFDILLWNTNYSSKFIIYSDKANLKETIEIENPDDITDDTNTRWIYVNKTRYAHVKRGMYLEAYYDESYYDNPTGEGYLLGMVPRKLVRIIDIKNDTVDTTRKILYADDSIKISDNGTVSNHDYYTTVYTSIDNYFTEYKGITMKPFTVNVDSIPNGTDDRQMEILTVLDKTTNLAKGLANKNRISWRYLVDSFGLGLTHDSKQEFVDLCGMKLNCLGFINMPSVRQFKTSLNPTFINDDRTLNTEYLKEGGNPDTNPSFLYSFGEGVGRSTVGYFFPYVKDVNDATKFIPPSAKVAKAYMSKFLTTTAGIYPWTIVAGSILGKLPDVASTEMRFTDDNLLDLMEMGSNPIDYTQQRGYYINSENTAQVFPYSSLSVIHSREVLIELENRLYDMLLNYQWRFNTPEIRNEIKSRADQICKELLDASALYDFKNVMDKSNNTNYIIDLQMGVLDTYIEIIKGMGVIVNNITILKKGTISSSGFLPK